MDSFIEIDSQLKEVQERRKEMILTAMDGRSQRYIATKTGIEETKLSRWINGLTDSLETSEVKKITKFLGVDFK